MAARMQWLAKVAAVKGWLLMAGAVGMPVAFVEVKAPSPAGRALWLGC